MLLATYNVATMIAQRMAHLKPSPTLALTARVAELRRKGEDVISFGAGEPDSITPEPIRNAAKIAIDEGRTQYTPCAGIAPLREAIRDKAVRDNNIHSTSDMVLVSCGAKHSVFNAIMVTCNPGDEVILITPCWMTYFEQIALAGALSVPVMASATSGFVPDIAMIKSAISSKTKAILINSPCNPTGAVFDRETLEDISKIALEHNLFIISDEIYEKHVYDGEKHISIASLSSEVSDRTITISGVSKSHCMTGWRIGYSIANEEITKAMTTLQDQVTSNPCSISQYAALSALQSPKSLIAPIIEEFDFRRTLILNELSKIPDVQCDKPKGAFYVFPDISHYLGTRIHDDVELAHYLLDEFRVACVPGSVFGGPGHLRITYAVSREDIVEGVHRISKGLECLI